MQTNFPIQGEKMKIFKRKEVFKYDRKIGMTIWRVLPGLSLAIAIFVSIGINPDCVSEQIKMAIIGLNVVYLVVDSIIRIWHYIERKHNEKIRVEKTEENRYVSKNEKITFWLIRIGTPLYLISMSITAILLNI